MTSESLVTYTAATFSVKSWVLCHKVGTGDREFDHDIWSNLLCKSDIKKKLQILLGNYTFRQL